MGAPGRLSGGCQTPVRPGCQTGMLIGMSGQRHCYQVQAVFQTRVRRVYRRVYPSAITGTTTGTTTGASPLGLTRHGAPVE